MTEGDRAEGTAQKRSGAAVAASQVTSHATSLSSPLSSVCLVQLFLGRLITDTTCPLQTWRSRPIAAPTCLSAAKTVSEGATCRTGGDLTAGLWLSTGRDHSQSSLREGFLKGDAHNHPYGTLPGKYWHISNFLSHITFSVAFVTCHTYHIHLEMVSSAGFQDTHFCLLP